MQLARGPAAGDPDRYAARLLATILGDESGSRFYWEFIDSGRAEAAAVGNYEYQGAGLIMTWICCAPGQSADNLQRVRRLQAELADRGVTDRELDLARRKISSHIILASERSENRMFSVGSQWLRGQEFRTPREISEIYQAITLEQVNEVARKYPLTDNMTLCVGPEIIQSPWPETN